MLQTVFDFGTVKVLGLEVPLHIYGYGLMLVMGFFTATHIARWRARRAGENPDCLTYCSLLALVGGVLGARIAYVIENWQTQFSPARSSLGEILNLSSGGLIYYGGVVLATVLVLAYLRMKRLPLRRYLDILAVSLMVGLAFGRAGCFLNGCCYGSTCNEHWALGMRFPIFSKPLIKLGNDGHPFPTGVDSPSPVYAHQLEMGQVQPDHRLIDRHYYSRTSRLRLIPPQEMDAEQIAMAEASRSRPVKPAQALGLANALILAALLTVFHRLRKREGQVFALMLVLYPITRFVLESIRDSNPHSILSGVLTHNQYTSLIFFGVGAAMWLALGKLPASCGPARAERQNLAGANRSGRKMNSR